MRAHLRRLCALSCIGALAVLGVVAGLPVPSAWASAPPALHMTGGTYHSGELIEISVGPNHYFKAYSRIVVLECADPGGKKKHLPTSAASCDGNTVQGDSVLVNKNGSFTEVGYTMYSLPNLKSLDEPADNKPVCNQKNACVLYVGENQENFTSPKVFSSSFRILTSRKHG